MTKDNIAQLVAECEIDHSIQPSKQHPGGRLEAEKRLNYFLTENLRRYANRPQTNQPCAPLPA